MSDIADMIAHEVGVVVFKAVVVAGLIFTAVGFVAGRATAADLTPDQARSIYYVAYGQFHGPREWLEQPPTVILTSADRLCDMYGMAPGCRVLGIYQPGIVYLDKTLDFDNLHDASVLLHEYTHHFQYLKRGKMLDCADWMDREREAYAIQANVLEKAGDERTAGMVRQTATSLHCN